MGTDPHLTEKLFYIFDEDGSGTVDYKELIIGLEVFKEDSIEDKMKGIIYNIINSVFRFMWCRWKWRSYLKRIVWSS